MIRVFEVNVTKGQLVRIKTPTLSVTNETKFRAKTASILNYVLKFLYEGTAVIDTTTPMLSVQPDWHSSCILAVQREFWNTVWKQICVSSVLSTIEKVLLSDYQNSIHFKCQHLIWLLKLCHCLPGTIMMEQNYLGLLTFDILITVREYIADDILSHCHNIHWNSHLMSLNLKFYI